MKRAQKNFERDPRQKIFLRAKPYGLVKAKIHEQSSWINYLNSAYDAAFAKIFTSHDKNIIRNCQYYCGLLPFNLRIDIKRFKFYSKFSSIQNDCLWPLYAIWKARARQSVKEA